MTSNNGTDYINLNGLLLYSLCLLLLVTTALAAPVSSPEIATKSGKTTNLSGHQHQQQQHQQHQQQQQQQQQKYGPQEAHLNSLNAYAINYESISNGNQQYNFKPSYKLPEMETNFTPIQSSGTPAADGGLVNPTPVLMHYLPQAAHDTNGVQYLQLIPTRPLIVPISTYLPGNSAAAQPVLTPAAPVVSPTYHQTLSAGHSVADYAGRAPPVLTAVPGNSVAPAATASLVDLHSNIPPYGIQTYAAALQPYRSSYRFNRETKNLPPSMSLNLNEYIPGPHEQPQPVYIRGRP